MVDCILAIDQGTTNSKAVLVDSAGRLVSLGSTSVEVSLPRPGWVEQDGEQIWRSVLDAVRTCLSAVPGGPPPVVGLALSTQRESVVAWHRKTGAPLGPVIGWQDRRTADWCTARTTAAADALVRERTGLRVDPMFSAPKITWLLEHAAASVAAADVCVGTIDAWLIFRLTGGTVFRCEAGNASRTLLYDVVDLRWSEDLLAVFDIPAAVLPEVCRSDAEFGRTAGVPGVPDGTPILAVLADSHAALYGQGCTEVGSAKATYGTGTSVMTPTARFVAGDSPVPSTLAWLTDVPTYAREGNILSSGAALVWCARLLGLDDVGRLVDLAQTVDSAGEVTLVPAFTGLGAPHWDRQAKARLTRMDAGTRPAHVARAAVDAVAHQVCDIVEVIQRDGARLAVLRADGGAAVSDLVMQTQADLLGLPVEVADVPEVSALGAAALAWASVDPGGRRSPARPRRTFAPGIDAEAREQRRALWRQEVRGIGTSAGS